MQTPRQWEEGKLQHKKSPAGPKTYKAKYLKIKDTEDYSPKLLIIQSHDRSGGPLNTQDSILNYHSRPNGFVGKLIDQNYTSGIAVSVVAVVKERSSGADENAAYIIETNAFIIF